jgi:hypothetical protein
MKNFDEKISMVENFWRPTKWENNIVGLKEENFSL